MKKLAAIAIHFLFNNFVVLVIFSTFVAGCGQIFHYLRYGDWVSISALDLLVAMGLKWAVSPTDWMGVFHVLEWLPLPLFSFLVLCMLGYLKFNFFENTYQVLMEKTKKLSFPKTERVLNLCLIFGFLWFGFQFFNKHQSEFHKETAGGLKSEEQLSGFK